MNVNFGISTMVYYQKPVEKLLPYLAKEEIDIIELRPKKDHFNPQKISELFKLKKQLEQKKISVRAIHMPVDGVDISHIQTYERIKSVREVEKTVLMAHHLGTDLVVVHPGAKVDNSDDKEKRLALSIESLKEIMDFCQNWKVKIALENTLPGRVGDKWDDIQLIKEKIPSKDLGICLDTGHYLLNYPEIGQGVLNLDKIPINWQENLLHIHLHDNDSKHDLHLLPQEGYFPWPSFMPFLSKIDYKGVLIFEIKKQKDLANYLNQVVTLIDKLKNLV
jgi:sugar phosphate isomerase/epimerase